MAFAPVFGRVFSPTFDRRAAVAAGNGLLTGLLAYWSLETAGATWDDAHASYDLTSVGSPSATAAKIGNGLDKRPYSNATYLYRNPVILFGDTDFTIACWAYAVSVSDNYAQAIVAVGDTNSVAATTPYQLSSWATSRKLMWHVGNGTTSGSVAIANGIVLDTWQFIVAWHDSVANQLYLQIDNGSVASASYTGGSATSSAHLTRVGTTQNAMRAWHGIIDDLGMWTRVLSADDRTALYNGGAGLAYAAFTT